MKHKGKHLCKKVVYRCLRDKSIALMLFALLIGTTSLGCLQPEGVKPLPPMEAKLLISGTPSLNQVVEVTFTATPLADAPNTTAEIMLPDGFELVSGDLFWEGDLKENEAIKLTATVKAVKIGDWVIYGVAESTQPEKWTFGKSDSLYISVFEDGTATVSKTPPPDNWVNTGGVLASQYSEGIQADLSLSSLPLLNKEVSLVFTVTPSIDLPDARVSVALPTKGMEVVEIKPPSRPTVPSEFTDSSGLDVLGKQFSWRGDIAKDETQSNYC